MIRPSLFVISHNSATTHALSQYFNALAPAFTKHSFNPESHSLTYSYIEEIHDFLSKNEPEVLLNSAVIFDYTDGYQLTESNLDPTAQVESRGNILAKLILAYPEVYWIILGTDINEPKNQNWKEHFVKVRNIGECFDRLQRHQNGYRTIFDPSGLRTEIKLTVLEIEKSDGETASKKETRSLFTDRQIYCAAALDEELTYTFLNGYTAYRFGYRCYTVTSKAEMLTLSEKAKVKDTDGTQSNKTINIALEDLELKFADMTSEDHSPMNGALDEAALIQRRDNAQNGYKFLPKDNANRIIITGSQKELDGQNGFTNVLKKPFSGMFDLYAKIKNTETHKAANKKQKASRESVSIKKLGYCAQKNANNRNRQSGSYQETFQSHSATNKIIVLGEILLGRARKISQRADTCPEAVHAATLALEGKELLYGRTMTTSLEMVAMQHKMEVTAECCFLGIGSQIKIDERASEIALSVDKILRIDYQSYSLNQLAQSYNAQIEIINNLRSIYKEYEQFDEEDFCIRRIRQLLQGLHYYNTLEQYNNLIKDDSNTISDSFFLKDIWYAAIKSPKLLWFNITRLVLIGSFLCILKTIEKWWYRRASIFIKKGWFRNGERYLNWLIGAGKNILKVTIGVILLWTLAFALLRISSRTVDLSLSGIGVFFQEIVFDSLLRSGETFFSIQPITDAINHNTTDLKGYVFHTISLMEMIIGYFHLGIFVAWLYQKLARR